MQTVNDRLQEGFRKRIETLNSHNTKTNEIKSKMSQEEKEKRDKSFWDFYLKQEEHHKRVKKQQKKYREEMRKKHYKSMEQWREIEHNKRNKEMEFERFKENVNAKHQK